MPRRPAPARSSAGGGRGRVEEHRVDHGPGCPGLTEQLGSLHHETALGLARPAAPGKAPQALHGLVAEGEGIRRGARSRSGGGRLAARRAPDERVPGDVDQGREGGVVA